jgi:integrase/recombinase XerD
MFEQLFKKAATISYFRTAPFAKERESFLSYLSEFGHTQMGLKQISHVLVHIAYALEHFSGPDVDRKEIEAAARQAAQVHSGYANAERYRKMFAYNAQRWMQFLGRYKEQKANPSPFDAAVNEFAMWMEQDRGLSQSTIETRRRQITSFLNWFGKERKSLTSICLADVDAFQAACSAKGLSRWSIRNRLSGIRSFLKYAGLRKWCSHSIAQGIQGPPIYAQEKIALGPSWDEIKCLISNLDTNNPPDIRDRAIIMLLAIYGLRALEVARVRLEDIDWDHDQIVVTRSKLRQAQPYPLVAAVGQAIVRYVKEVRPQCQYRELFISMRAPWRPVSRVSLYNIVDRRFKRLGIHSSVHRGPHALRHACAGHLLAKGLTLKEIGDHLGHKSAKSTRIYTKVDLIGLREVASFDLGGVL